MITFAVRRAPIRCALALVGLEGCADLATRSLRVDLRAACAPWAGSQSSAVSP